MRKKLFTLILCLAFLLAPATVIYAQEEYTTTTDDEVIYQIPDEVPVPTLYDENGNEIVPEVPTLYDSEGNEITLPNPDEDYDMDWVSPDVDPDEYSELGGIFLLISGFVWLLMMGVSIALYIFLAIGLQKLGKEMGYKRPWFAWIPILNMFMFFKLGDQNPLLVLLLLVPFIGIFIYFIFFILAAMKLTEKRGYDKVLALIILTGIGTYILIYLLAWKPKSVNAEIQQPQPVIPEVPITEEK